MLDSIVNASLVQHGGGELFFNKLDSDVRNPIVANLLLDLGLLDYRNIIVSGRFGVFFWNEYGRLFPNIIIARGNLKEASRDISLEIFKDSIDGRNFAFVDDSFYSGFTRNTIQAEIRRLNGNLVRSFVIYDGSKVKDDSVDSLIRYYS